MLLTHQRVLACSVHSPRQFPQQLCSISTPCCVAFVQWSSFVGVLRSHHTFSHPQNHAFQLQGQKHYFSCKCSYVGKNDLSIMDDGSLYIMSRVTFHVLDGVWGEQPAACVESHHAGSGRGATNQAHWGHFVSSLLQHLPVYMHWEYLRLWAHTHQMQAHRGMGTHTDIWKEKNSWFSWSFYWLDTIYTGMFQSSCVPLIVK